MVKAPFRLVGLLILEKPLPLFNARPNRTYRMLRFVTKAFFFTCLTYKNDQRFRNRQVHEFYGLKASQMSKVRTSSHEYPHVEKIKNLHEQNLEGTPQSDFSGYYLSLTLV